MKPELEKVAREAGFVPPPFVSMRKHDPRGPEYGYFEVSNVVTCRSVARVTKCDQDDRRMWSCTFGSLHDFQQWAKENA